MNIMVIDANMYWLPEELFEDHTLMQAFLAEIPAHYHTKGYVASVGEQKKQVVIEKPEGYPNLNYVQGQYRLEDQLADMDCCGVDHSVLKLSCCQEWMSLELCKKFNTGMAEHVKCSNGRMTALAVLPPRGDAAVFAELDRCVNELGMKGVQLVAHYGQLYLDDPAFATFFEKLNEYHMTVYIHHTPVPVEYQSLYSYTNVRRSYGRFVDQGTAVCRELFSGFFDQYPNLKLVHSMLGGGFFAMKQILTPHAPKNADEAARFETAGGYSEYLKNNVFFEMSHAQPWGKEALECAIRVLGADHILFGSSYPVRKEWLTEGVDFVRQLNISEKEKTLILGGNAQRLYHI
jgi:predicted TIM-barrel fold metal-dependent hydrolase